MPCGLLSIQIHNVKSILFHSNSAVCSNKTLNIVVIVLYWPSSFLMYHDNIHPLYFWYNHCNCGITPWATSSSHSVQILWYPDLRVQTISLWVTHAPDTQAWCEEKNRPHSLNFLDASGFAHGALSYSIPLQHHPPCADTPPPPTIMVYSKEPEATYRLSAGSSLAAWTGRRYSDLGWVKEMQRNWAVGQSVRSQPEHLASNRHIDV